MTTILQGGFECRPTVTAIVGEGAIDNGLMVNGDLDIYWIDFAHLIAHINHHWEIVLRCVLSDFGGVKDSKEQHEACRNKSMNRNMIEHYSVLLKYKHDAATLTKNWAALQLTFAQTTPSRSATIKNSFLVADGMERVL
jgi:hypothetical protein